MSSISLSPAPTTLSIPAPAAKTKHQEEQYDGLARDDDDDDISLAKCMTRRLQLNQQMYPWMSPGLVALHQQRDSPTPRDSTHAINTYSYTQYHQLQLQLQYQQQLMLQYKQQQQQQQNLTGYNGPSLGQHHHHYHRHQQRNIGMKQQPIMRKSKSAQLDADHNPKTTRMSPATFNHRVSWSSLNNTSPSSTNTPKKDSRHQRHSLLSLQSDDMTKNHYSQRGRRLEQQQRHEVSPSTTSVAKQIMTRRSSIYSHASGNSSSTTSASNMTNTTNELTQSSVSTSMSKNHNKPSLSKRIRGMIMGKSTNKQIHTAPSSASSSLRRSSSVTSGASSVITTKTADNGDGSSRSLWTNLLRKSSRSGPANYNVEKQFVHGKRTNGQKDVVPDSPASSVSGGSYHRSLLHQENYFVDDLPSPASSTSPESPLNHPTDQQHPINHLDSLQRIEPIGQLDYFGLPPPTSQQQQQTKNRPYTLLQHGSPRLRPSSNNQQSSSSLLVAESDDLRTCLLETSIPSNSNKSPVIALPPIPSASASTSTSSLALDHQQCDNIKPAIKSFSSKPNAKIQFATTIQVHDTFGSQDYDRRCDTQVTCQRLSMVLALQIKKELNEYKLNEMEVHLRSRQNTQFFL